MRFLVRTLLVAGLAMGLGACNLVTTTEPMFDKADAAGTPQLKEGLWANLEHGCEADLKQPATEWPECAEWMVLKNGEMTGKSDDEKEETRIPVLIAGDDPPVMQLAMEDKDSKETLYFYAGLGSIETDSEGRIIRYAGWIVQCGPPPPEDAKRPDGQPRWGTFEPTPGIIMDEALSGCRPQDETALFTAARASKDYASKDKPGEARWVRRTYP